MSSNTENKRSFPRKQDTRRCCREEKREVPIHAGGEGTEASEDMRSQNAATTPRMAEERRRRDQASEEDRQEGGDPSEAAEDISQG